MNDVQWIESEETLAQINAEIETRVQAAQAARPVWPCKKGCDLCCRRLAQPLELTAVEWHRLQTGLAQLSKDIQAEIEQKILALREWDEAERPFIVCPMLDEKAGACHVYAHRPAACRMYGFYVSRHNNQWCHMIDELFEARELEGVTLGNLTAIKRQIRQELGLNRSIVDWYKN